MAANLLNKKPAAPHPEPQETLSAPGLTARFTGVHVAARVMHAPGTNLSKTRTDRDPSLTDAGSAIGRLKEIYERNTRFLRDHFEAYVNGKPPVARVRATYPFVRIATSSHVRLNSRLSYGFVTGPGTYETTVTRPDLFEAYLTEQIGLLMENHRVPVEIGESHEPIPVHFAYRRDINAEGGLSNAKLPADLPLRDVFNFAGARRHGRRDR